MDNTIDSHAGFSNIHTFALCSFGALDSFDALVVQSTAARSPSPLCFCEAGDRLPHTRQRQPGRLTGANAAVDTGISDPCRAFPPPVPQRWIPATVLLPAGVICSSTHALQPLELTGGGLRQVPGAAASWTSGQT